ncbi:MAG: acylphosphatase [Elusimicrobia bacterium]|nr:acylphosphatase [Elusimicrobiota bacterium]
MDKPLTRRWHVTVRGRVQGVGYRWFVREQASQLGVAGWVRNHKDGTVELEAEGNPEALRRLMEMLRGGHPYARVDGLKTEEIAPRGEKSFEIVR